MEGFSISIALTKLSPIRSYFYSEPGTTFWKEAQHNLESLFHVLGAVPEEFPSTYRQPTLAALAGCNSPKPPWTGNAWAVCVHRLGSKLERPKVEIKIWLDARFRSWLVSSCLPANKKNRSYRLLLGFLFLLLFYCTSLNLVLSPLGLGTQPVVVCDKGHWSSLCLTWKVL